MQPWNRPAEPAELKAQRKKLTQEFVAEKRTTGKIPDCKWPKVANNKGEPQKLSEYLADSTDKHCSYCDGLIGHTGRNTIDHFRPKSKAPCLAYAWQNLYLCCDGCQGKSTNYDPLALRPDEPEYTFSRYFCMRYDGVIRVIAVEENDRVRAEATVKFLKLNAEKLQADRRHAIRLNSQKRLRPRPSRGLNAQNASMREPLTRPDDADKPYRFYWPQMNDF